MKFKVRAFKGVTPCRWVSISHISQRCEGS